MVDSKENYKFDLRVKELKHRCACEYAEAQKNNMQHFKYAFHYVIVLHLLLWVK